MCSRLRLEAGTFGSTLDLQPWQLGALPLGGEHAAPGEGRALGALRNLLLELEGPEGPLQPNRLVILWFAGAASSVSRHHGEKRHSQAKKGQSTRPGGSNPPALSLLVLQEDLS